jgi:hypothetical protein
MCYTEKDAGRIRVENTVFACGPRDVSEYTVLAQEISLVA